jgi:putative inorganic carbon (hco3(-)) transporter
MNRRNSLIALLALCFVLANHSFYIYLWTAPAVSNTGLWAGFRSIGLSLTDFPLLLYVVFGCIALMSNNQLYLEFSALTKAIILNYGAFWFLILFAWMLCSSLWAGDNALSRFDALHFFLELIAGLGLAYLVSKGWEKSIVTAFVVASVVQSILAILQLWQGQSLGLSWLLEPIRDVSNPFGYLEQGFRGYGLERHPNLLAGSLFLAMFACFLYWNSPWFKAALAIIALGIVASLSRSVIVIAGVSGLLLVLLRGNWSKRQSLIGVSLGCLLVAVAIGLFGQQIWADMQERTLLYLQYPGAFFERLSFADGDTIAVWLKSPFLGVGAGNLPLEIAHLRAAYSGLLLPVHNVFLYVLAELGIVGFVCLFMGLSSIWGQAHRANTREIQIVAVSFIGLSLIMCFDFYFWEESRLRMLFFLWMGLYWGYRWRSASSVA